MNFLGEKKASYIKPFLTIENKIKRLQFILNQIDRSDPLVPRFWDQYNVIHSDEKWFYLQDLKKKRLNFPGEDEFPPDKVTSKRHRTQVMITVIVSRPSLNNPDYDGTIMIQPHGSIIPCRRNSANRPAGTLEFKSHTVDSTYFFDQQVGTDGIINGIINKLSPEDHIYIQIDNAPPH